VPAGVVLHVGHALALGGLHEDDGGLAGALVGVEFLKSGLDLAKIVAVDLDHMASECLELGVHRLGVHDVAGAAINLQAVDVGDDAQVVQLVVGGEHSRLPDLALGQLAVAQQGVYVRVFAQELGALGHAGGGGQTLAQGAGGHIHAGDGVHVGVALQGGVDVAQGGQRIHGEIAPVGQRGIQAGGGVALGENEAVPLLPAGVLRVDPHLFEIEVGEHVGGGQAAAGMAGLRAVGAGQDALPDADGGQLQGFLFIRSHCFSSLLCYFFAWP